MSWDFLVWLVSFILQVALLGIVMYGLISLSDLENDFINPHDSSARINKLVLPEYIAQGGLAVLLLLSGKWLFGALQMAITAYHFRLFIRDQAFVDVTEIFKQLSWEKKLRIAKFVVYLVFFIYCVYRLVETAVNSLLTPSGREEARRLFQDAAASF